MNITPQISGAPSVIEAEGRKVVAPFELSDNQTSADNLFILLAAQPPDYIQRGQVLIVSNGVQRNLILKNNSNAKGTGKFSEISLVDDLPRSACTVAKVNSDLIAMAKKHCWE